MSFQEAAGAYLRSEIMRRMSPQITDEDTLVVKSFWFHYSPGYHYSSYTFEDPRFSVYVEYELNGRPRSLDLYDDEITTMGAFLTGLLAHEEQEQ